MHVEAPAEQEDSSPRGATAWPHEAVERCVEQPSVRCAPRRRFADPSPLPLPALHTFLAHRPLSAIPTCPGRMARPLAGAPACPTSFFRRASTCPVLEALPRGHPVSPRPWQGGPAWPAGRLLLLLGGAAVTLSAAAAAAVATPLGAATAGDDSGSCTAAAAAGAQPPPLPFDAAAAVGGGPPLGRFETLPSLQCDVRSRVGADSCRGVSFRANRSASPEFVPIGVGTCDAPVRIAHLPDVVSGLDNATLRHKNCTTRSALRPTKVDLRTTPVHYDALPSDGGNGRLAYEEDVARLLTMQRNTSSGFVLRQTAVFDVIAVTRETVGICDDEYCNTVFAADLVSGSEAEENGTHHIFPIVSFRPPGFDTPLPVLAGDEGLLSQGRAVTTDPGWLLRDPAWRSYMAGDADVHLLVDPSAQPSNTLPDGLRSARWSLGANSSYSELPSPWLRAITYVFCQPPATSFVRHPELLCEGLVRPTPHEQSGRGQGVSFVDGKAQLSKQHPSSALGRSALQKKTRPKI